MAKRMLIDANHPEETRVVVLEGNRLDEFDFESSTKKQVKGNIYLAKVTRVEPSLQAAFVDYGGNRHGFLPFNEIHPDYYRIPVGDRGPGFAEPETAPAPEEAVAESGVPLEAALPEAVAVSFPASGGEEENGEGDPLAAPDAPAASAAAPAKDEAEPSEEEPADSALAAVLPDPDPDAEGALFDEADSEPGEEDTEPGEADSEPGEEDEPFADSPAAEGRRALVAEPREPVERDGEGDGDGLDAESVEIFGGDEIEEVGRPRPLRQYKIQEVIKRRQIMLVQVTKEERGNKGAALTSYLSLAGRYCVLMPNTARGGGISRKITSPGDRRRLKDILEELELPEGMGVIVRTAGNERSKAEIRRDYEYLLRLWNEIRDRTLRSTAPVLIYEEGNLIKRSIRDLYTRDIGEVLVEGEEGYKTAKAFMKMLMPSHAKRVQPYRDAQIGLFHRYQVESQIDAIHSPIVHLRSGGTVVINQTEALVAIDVNSGRSTRERNIEETALRTNVEAAEEIARQLRLRDLAGLIVVDFIDMEEHRNQVTVERRLKEALKNDRARIQLSRISPFGLLELSRQRLRPSLAETSTQPCPYCAGTGSIRSTESAALHVLRSIEEEGIRQRSAEICVYVPTTVALYILNQKRSSLVQIEERYAIHVTLARDDDLIPPNFRLERLRVTAPGEAPPPAPLALVPALDEAEEEEAEETAEEGAPPQRAAAKEESGEHPRRRRRRRRRRSEEEGAEAAPSGASEEGRAAEPHAQREAAGEPEEEAAAATGEEESDEEDRRRRRRGRRGGRRRRRDGTLEPARAGTPRADGEAPRERGRGRRRTRSATEIEPPSPISEEVAILPTPEDFERDAALQAPPAADSVLAAGNEEERPWPLLGNGESVAAEAIFAPEEEAAEEAFAAEEEAEEVSGAEEEAAEAAPAAEEEAAEKVFAAGDGAAEAAPMAAAEASSVAAPEVAPVTAPEAAPEVASAAAPEAASAAEEEPPPAAEPEPQPEPPPEPSYPVLTVTEKPAKPRRGWWKRAMPAADGTSGEA